MRPCELAARRVPLGGRRGMAGGCAGAQLGGRGKAGAAVGAAAASGARLGGRCGRASSQRGRCRWAGVAAWPAGALRCGCAGAQLPLSPLLLATALLARSPSSPSLKPPSLLSSSALPSLPLCSTPPDRRRRTAAPLALSLPCSLLSPFPLSLSHTFSPPLPQPRQQGDEDGPRPFAPGHVALANGQATPHLMGPACHWYRDPPPLSFSLCRPSLHRPKGERG